MSPDGFHATMQSIAFPATLRTRDGRTYPVAGPGSWWVPPDYPATVAVSAPGRGIRLLTLAAVAGVEPTVE